MNGTGSLGRLKPRRNVRQSLRHVVRHVRRVTSVPDHVRDGSLFQPKREGDNMQWNGCGNTTAVILGPSPKPDVRLSSGTVVKHLPMQNGATYAYIGNDDEMTESDWQEYCAKRSG